MVSFPYTIQFAVIAPSVHMLCIILFSAPSFEPNGVRSTENGRAFFAEPDFSTTSREVTLLKPCKEERGCPDGRPLFVYAPGLDCTGRGIRKQLFSLYSAGHAKCPLASSRSCSPCLPCLLFLGQLLCNQRSQEALPVSPTFCGHHERPEQITPPK
eukprot:Gb_25175 [translate_table: standard]